MTNIKFPGKAVGVTGLHKGSGSGYAGNKTGRCGNAVEFIPTIIQLGYCEEKCFVL